MNDTYRPTFQSILDESPTSVDYPKPTPVGSYLCRIPQPEYGKSSLKKTPFVQYDLKILSALEDVDPAALAECGDVAGRTIRATYYTTEDAIYRLDEFHAHCGIDLGKPASRRQRNEAIVNGTVVAHVRHEEENLSKEDLANGVVPRVFARLSRTAPA